MRCDWARLRPADREDLTRGDQASWCPRGVCVREEDADTDAALSSSGAPVYLAQGGRVSADALKRSMAALILDPQMP